MPYYCQHCNKVIKGRIYETEKVINNSMFLCQKCCTIYREKLKNNEDIPRFRPYFRNDIRNETKKHNMPGYVSDSEAPLNSSPDNKRKKIQIHMVIPENNKNNKNQNINQIIGRQTNNKTNDDYIDDEDNMDDKDHNDDKNSSNNKGNKESNNGNIPNDLKEMMDFLFGNTNVNYIEIDPKNIPKHLDSGANPRKRKSQLDEHREYKKRIINYPFEWLGNDVKNIDDLIKLGNDFNPKKKIRGNLNLLKLNKLVQPLQKLKNMIGLQEVKKVIFEEAIYFLQDLDEGNKEMLHTVIAGPPGVGKTQLAHIIADYYNALGFLKTNKVVSVKRNDLVAGYLGQSAIKTKKKLDEALGGVLLIDEAYSLGDTAGGKDSYSKEVIDLLTSYLSEHAHELVCVIAGYKDALDDRFFSQNQGLARRFTKRYTINGYSGNELFEIFKTCVDKNSWKMTSETDKLINKKIFIDNQDIFKNFGGDMETLFNCCKKVHSKRLLCIETEEVLNQSKKNINNEDIIQAVDLFKQITDKKVERTVQDICPYLYT